MKKMSIIDWTILIVCLISAFLSSGHVLSIVDGQVTNYAIALSTALLLLRTIILRKSVRIHGTETKLFFVVFGMLFVDIISNILYSYSMTYSFRFFLILLYSYIFTKVVSFSQFKKIFINFMILVCMFAIAGYIWGLTNGFFYPLPTIKNINGVSYYSSWLYYALNDYSRGRNIGIFWEPGIFAIFIVLATMMMTYEKNEMKVWKFVIFIVALFTTLSTTGFFLMIIVFASLLFQSNNKALARFGIFVVAVVLISMIFVDYQSILLQLFPRVFTKMYDGSASYVSRTLAITSNMQNFIEHPFGVGLTHANVLFVEKVIASQSSSMTLYLVEFGLFGLAFVLMQIIGILKNKDWSMPQRVLFAIVWTVCMNVEPTTFFSIFHIISFYLINRTNECDKTDFKLYTSKNGKVQKYGYYNMDQEI